MAVLESHVEPSEEHDRRRERMEQLVAELRERTAQVALGGGEKAVDRAVFVRLVDGTVRRFKPLRHCGEAGLTTVYARTPVACFRTSANAVLSAEYRLGGQFLISA